jgi:hypothetical protein
LIASILFALVNHLARITEASAAARDQHSS